MIDIGNKLLHLDWGFIDETYSPKFLPELLDTALRNRQYSLLQYNDGLGIEELRELACEFLSKKFSIKNISAANICITNGATAGLDLIARYILQKEYDSVYFEPVYDTAIQSLKINSRKSYGIKIDPFNDILISEQAWIQLEEILSQEKTKLFYIVPNFNNPLGVIINVEDRIKILDLCKKHNVIIVEDDPYKLYNFTNIELPENLINLDTDKNHVLYINSISKLLYPGIRIGYIVGSQEHLTGISEIQKYTTSSANLLMQGISIEALKSNKVEESYNYYHERILQKREILAKCFVDYKMHEIMEYKIPDGGFYIWGRLKDTSKNTKELLSIAKSKLVTYVPGHIYFTDSDVYNCLRIAYSQIELSDIEVAVSRLKETLI